MKYRLRETKPIRQATFAAAACVLALLGAGCERASGPGAYKGSGVVPPYADDSFRALSGARGVYMVTYDIYSIDPTQGPLAGLNPAELTGVFPAGAQSAYTVYFGANAAGYDGAFSPPMTASAIYVTVPPGDAPGLVDVILRENLTQLDAAALYYGYEYLDPFAITDVIPAAGPTAGNQQVRVEGRFPIAAPIATAAQAYSAYRVYFDGIQAGYDTSFNPVITSTAMYVITPPHAPGLVNVSVATVEANPRFRVLVDGYEYLAPLDVIEVDPNIGWIFGFEQVAVRGTYPVTTAFSNSVTAVTAADYYYVQFGNRIAQFDPFLATPVITAEAMYVLSPPGENVGFVDVSVGGFDDSGNVIALDTLSQAYRYYAMYMLRAVPNQGPSVGGQEVRLEGIFPGLASITDIYAAYAIYGVYFDNLRASFAPQPPGDPVFFPSQIDTINQTYTIGYMYVTTPPHAPGLVDVRIEDLTDTDLPTTCPLCYEYLDLLDGIESWDNAIVLPNPVGKLLAGELFVRIEGSGDVPNQVNGSTDLVFIVPQGGDPLDENDRILIEQTAYSESGGEFVWEGTNVDPIPRVMDNGLLVDGHAAVFLDNDGEIIGDSLDPTDGGIIGIDAQEGRHFLIDTIPPRLLAQRTSTGTPALPALRADDLVDPNLGGFWLTDPSLIDQTDVITGLGGTGYPSVFHPYPLPIGAEHLSTTLDAPYDGRTLTRPAASENVAQMFFNVSSFSNGFPDGTGTNLQFIMDNVVFEDPDIYTVLGRTPGANDTNFFVPGSTVRQQAGFPNAADLPINLTNLPRDEAFITDPDLLSNGQFQSSPFRLPDVTGISIDYQVAGATEDGGGASLSPNLAVTPSQLIANYTMGDGTPASGVDVSTAGPISLMPIVFRAVDRAGDYRPLGDPNNPRKKLWTRNDTTPTEGYITDQQPEMGPLNLWWLRATGTRIVSTVPSNGDALDPSFSWEPTPSPIPPGIVDDFGEGSQRLYSYAVYGTDPSAGLSRDDQRDGPYSNVIGWSAWSPDTTLTFAQIAAAVPDGIVEGVWFLLVVMSVDEAGNVEVWPTEQLEIDVTNVNGGFNSPTQIDFVDESGGDEERNWERWYVPPRTETVETIVEPFFWHDSTVTGTFGVVDANENTFGSAEVIPYPIPAQFNPLQGILGQRVMAQFRVTLVTYDEDATVSFTITENGQQVDSGFDIAQSPDGSFIVTIIRPDPSSALYLGSANRAPTYYRFQAWTVNQTVDNVADSSPATVDFVVVDNVADYIRNRDETQPIRESDVN